MVNFNATVSQPLNFKENCFTRKQIQLAVCVGFHKQLSLSLRIVLLYQQLSVQILWFLTQYHVYFIVAETVLVLTILVLGV